MRAHWIALLVLLAVVVWNGWVGDDAYITLRTVDHALQGHGLRFNVLERVQAYTHPLWMLVLLVAHGITGEPFFGTVAAGVLATAVMLGLLGKHLRPAELVVAALLLMSSRAFVHYSTSGLENPLTHLLLVAMLFTRGRSPQAFGWVNLLFALALTLRFDLVLLLGPLWLAHVGTLGRDLRRTHLVAGALGWLPLFAWLAFATVYYGTALPNPVLAKLATGMPRAELVGRGWSILAHPFLHDPATALALLGLPLLLWRHPALFVGCLLHLAGLVWVGGDFMAGRMLSPLVVAAVFGLSVLPLSPKVLVACTVATIGLAVGWPFSPIRGATTLQPAWHGIVDERAFYAEGSSIAGGWGGHRFADQGRAAAQRVLVERAAIGMFGYHAGPGVHVLDPLGLAEPLLARLPARYDPTWRIGHYRRAIPAGYDPSGPPGADDPDLRKLDRRVRALTRGSLWDPQRWLDGAVLTVSVGHDTWDQRFAGIEVLEALPSGPVVVGPRGLLLLLDSPTSDVPVLEPENGWTVLFGRSTEILLTVPPGQAPSPPPSWDRLYLFPAHEQMLQGMTLRNPP